MTIRELRDELNKITDNEELDAKLKLQITNKGSWFTSEKNIEFDGFDTLYGDMTDCDSGY